MMAYTRKRDVKGGTACKQKMWHALRVAQRVCGCNTRTLKALFEAVEPFCNTVPTSATDEDLCATANAVVMQLHGCVRCDDFVFSPDNSMLRCPKCAHPRFNRQKQPNEVSCFVSFV